MLRKGSQVIAKLVCLWVFLGAYHFWKRQTVTEWRDNTPTSSALVRDGAVLHVADDKNNVKSNSAGVKDLADDKLSRSIQDDEGLRWIHSNQHASSRHLLAPLVNCTPRAVEQFPWDFLTPEQRKDGFIVIHVLVALYMFMALSIVCDRYFVPALEILCELLHMETDIAGATFMAAGSSAPELATAVIGVFVAQDDVGLGTVVGSAIYNVMFVISMCALFATSSIHLNWWPMLRDCMAYLLSVVALIVIIYDAKVQWHESVILLVMYLLYVLFMYFNERLEVWCVPRVNMCCRCNTTLLTSETTVLYDKLPANGHRAENGESNHLTDALDHAHQEAETWHKLCERPEGCVWSCVWITALPLSTFMFLTVPDCRRPSLRKWFWVTFLLSLVWLSIFSFIMVWMITVIGFTFNVPDSVMSLTFIAFGVSLPDVVSSVLVCRDGLGDMAVSNAIGSNVFDILVCLGIPWFLETCVKDPGSEVQVYSEGLVYSSLMLLSTVFFLLIATHVNGWRLTKKYGVLLLVVYVLYTLLASMYELNIFGYFHPPECVSNY
ncbi:sodium/potassium/calcium exchanger 5-like isoform X2 [Littorina saxatilis]|uniref:sodium/potassium/calcium exchanger 5-like isoform X2 n=1 Tax=Littorina saxatilis TaxID=31220 RepID=UPI0038B42703